MNSRGAQLAPLVRRVQLVLLGFWLTRFATVQLILPIHDFGSKPWRTSAALQCGVLTWVLFAPRVLRWVKSRPFGGHGPLAALAYHLPRALLVSVTGFAIKVAALWALGLRTSDNALWAVALAIVPVQFLSLDAVIYLAVGGTASAFWATERAQAEEIHALRLKAELQASRWQLARHRLDSSTMDGALERLAELCEIDPRAAAQAITRLGDVMRRMLEELDRALDPPAGAPGGDGNALDLQRELAELVHSLPVPGPRRLVRS